MGFNTQPPEGGWAVSDTAARAATGFNTQPPEGGWAEMARRQAEWEVSTHSRLKAAGQYRYAGRLYGGVSTHSRLKAAGPAGSDFPSENA